MTKVHCPECGAGVVTRALERRSLDRGAEVVEVPYRCSSLTCRYHSEPYPFGAFWGQAGEE